MFARGESQQVLKPELKGYTASVLATMADISVSHAFLILSGQRMPGRTLLKTLADIMSVSMDELHEELLARQRAA